MPKPDMVLANIDQARVLLLAARDAPEAKRIADLARAAEVYAKRQKLSEEIIGHARAIKVDALTLMGEFLKGQGMKPGRPRERNGSPGEPFTPTLSDAGIGKKESSTAQALATLKQEKPELHERVKAGAVTIPQAKREVIREERRTALKSKAESVISNGKPTWKIRCGDCIEELAKLEAGSVRLAFADPPYNIGIDYGQGAERDRLSDADFLDWSRRWIDGVARLLTDDGSLWVLINDEWADYFGCMLRGAGLHRRSWIKWYESFGVNTPNNFNRCSRHLFYCVKDSRRFVFNAEFVTRESERQRLGDKRADPNGKTWDDVWGIDPPIPRVVGNHPDRMPDFPTQLPIELLRAVVGCASDPGDLVVDPFNGSGTTGVACIELGRRYVGFDVSPHYVEMAKMRLKITKGRP